MSSLAKQLSLHAAHTLSNPRLRRGRPAAYAPYSQPAMRRVQDALKRQLTQQKAEVDDEVRAQKRQLALEEKKREEVGVQLYTAQQQLVRLRTELERVQDKYGDVSQRRQETEEALKARKAEQSSISDRATAARKAAAGVQQEYDSLRGDYVTVRGHAQELRSKVAVQKRAASKTSKEQDEAEAAKQKQDLYIDRQNERVKQLQNEIKIARAQREAQTVELHEGAAALQEAQLELDEIVLRRKELQRLWQGSLLGLQKRNDALAAMQTAVREQTQELLAKDRELGGAAASLRQLQETNEVLVARLANLQADLTQVDRKVETNQMQHDEVKREYTTMTKTLQQMETELAKAQQLANIRYTEMKMVRERAERIARAKVDMEERLVREMQGKLTVDKASKATAAAISALRLSISKQEATLSQVENDVARQSVEEEVAEQRMEQHRQNVKEQQAISEELNAALTRYEKEIRANNIAVARKQAAVDQYNRKINALKTKLMAEGGGDADITPAEIEIRALHRAITETDAENSARQRVWLSKQSELVQVEEAVEDAVTAVEELRTKYRVMSHKRLRVDDEIQGQREQLGKLQRGMQTLQTSLTRMSELASQNTGLSRELQQSTQLMEGDFLRQLKLEELESIQLQESLDAILHEKAELLERVMDAERTLLLWEKKITLAKETKASLNSAEGADEIGSMKKEIHRMEVRYTSLQKQKEELIVEMERSVSRRETIHTKAKVAAKKGTNTVDKVKREIADLQKRTKQTLRDANNCEAEISQLSAEQETVRARMQELDALAAADQERLGMLQAAAQQKAMEYTRGLEDTVHYQQAVKHFEAVQNKTIKLACKVRLQGRAAACVCVYIYIYVCVCVCV